MASSEMNKSVCSDQRDVDKCTDCEYTLHSLAVMEKGPS